MTARPTAHKTLPVRLTKGYRLTLTSEFALTFAGDRVDVPHSVERVLAMLGLSRHPLARNTVAGQLWPDVSDRRALGNLRSALWRLGSIPAATVDVRGDRLALGSAVTVDLAELSDVSHQLLSSPDRASLLRFPDLMKVGDLLPGWEEEWLIVERERFRELRLHALEHAAEALLAVGDAAHATEAALAVVATEPYRESARRLLIRVYLSEGNRAAALRHYQDYCRLMREELHVRPSELMERLVGGLGLGIPTTA